MKKRRLFLPLNTLIDGIFFSLGFCMLIVLGMSGFGLGEEVFCQTYISDFLRGVWFLFIPVLVCGIMKALLTKIYSISREGLFVVLTPMLVIYAYTVGMLFLDFYYYYLNREYCILKGESLFFDPQYSHIEMGPRTTLIIFALLYICTILFVLDYFDKKKAGDKGKNKSINISKK